MNTSVVSLRGKSFRVHVVGPRRNHTVGIGTVRVAQVFDPCNLSSSFGEERVLQAPESSRAAVH